MAEYDPILGAKVAAHLAGLRVETPFGTGGSKGTYQSDLIQKTHGAAMIALGLDLSDASLRDTPQRVAKMYCQEIFTGLDYSQFPKCSTFPNEMASNELIIVKDVDVLSVCEHHFVPFIGKACVGYIPDQTLVGLSKLHRVVDFFSRRPQVQERLTLQIYHALSFILGTGDVAITIEAEHMCVRLRGVKQANSTTITSQMGGKFMAKPELRQEFLNLVRK